MTDAAESQSSDSDYPDAQELIGSQQKGPCKAHTCETSTRVECSCSRQNAAASEESSAEPNSIHESAASAGVLLVSSDSEMDLSATSGSECHPECSTAPLKHKMRLRSSRQQTESVAEVSDSESSSDSSLPPLVQSSETSQKQKSKLNLKAILAYHFRGKKFRAAAHRKYRIVSWKKKKRERTPREAPLVGRRLTASPQEQRRRLLHRGFQFPFVQEHYGKKQIPLKMVLEYEQAAAKGFFRYIEMLKYEDHLKKALKTLQASEDLERQCLSVRKHKYLDDEGPISPIQETNNDDDNLNSDNPEQFDARVVENSSFIISSKIPSKKKSKRAKSTEVIEIEDDCLCC